MVRRSNLSQRQSQMKRRNFIQAGIAGGITLGLGIRSLVTGVPPKVLLWPLEAEAASNDSACRQLICFGTHRGDPMNTNTPGTFDDPAHHHPDPNIYESMAPTPMMIGSSQHIGAKAWADLGPDRLSQTCFIHHATNRAGHGATPKVLNLNGRSKRGEQFTSFFAQQLAAPLGTIADHPLDLGLGGAITHRGIAVPVSTPTTLRGALGRLPGVYGDLQSLRDTELDRLNDLYKDHGTPHQRQMLDRFATARHNLRQVGPELLNLLETIESDGTDGQIAAAPILLAMGLAPVLWGKMGWGGDNHVDPELGDEAGSTAQSIQQLAGLHDNIKMLQQGGLLGEVVVAVLNEFGRGLGGQDGRAHNPNHNVLLLMGDGVQAGVVGGLDGSSAGDFDPISGQLATDGLVVGKDSLTSVAKTIGALMGVDRAATNEFIDEGHGHVIEAALLA